MASTPHKLHFVWIQGEAAMPPAFQFNVGTWRAKNPGCTVQVHDCASLRTALAAAAPEALPAFDAAGFANKKDLGVWALLLRDGGFFCDVDFQANRSVVPLLDASPLVLFGNHNVSGLNSSETQPCLLAGGGAAGHPVLRAIVAHMAAVPFTRNALAYTVRLCRAFSRTVTESQAAMVSTPLQFFLEPASQLGLDVLGEFRFFRTTEPLHRGSGIAFPTTRQGSWHNWLQKAYLYIVYRMNSRRNVWLFVAALCAAAVMIATLVVACIALHRASRRVGPRGGGGGF